MKKDKPKTGNEIQTGEPKPRTSWPGNLLVNNIEYIGKASDYDKFSWYIQYEMIIHHSGKTSLNRDLVKAGIKEALNHVSFHNYLYRMEYIETEMIWTYLSGLREHAINESCIHYRLANNSGKGYTYLQRLISLKMCISSINSEVCLGDIKIKFGAYFTDDYFKNLRQELTGLLMYYCREERATQSTQTETCSIQPPTNIQSRKTRHHRRTT